MALLGVGSSILIARLFGVRVVGEFALASAPAGALLVPVLREGADRADQAPHRASSRAIRR